MFCTSLYLIMHTVIDLFSLSLSAIGIQLYQFPWKTFFVKTRFYVFLFFVQKEKRKF